MDYSRRYLHDCTRKQKSKYKKEYGRELAEYEAVYPAKIKQLNEKIAELRIHAEKLISGNAA